MKLQKLKREEAALSVFIQSLKSYSSGLKNLEYNTQRGLNEIQTVDKMVVMTDGDKAWQVAGKTITNDIIGGDRNSSSVYLWRLYCRWQYDCFRNKYFYKWLYRF